MSVTYNLIAIVGPTASGKTAFAAHLAGRLNGEIISADSRQVYRQMNIGTGKDYADYHLGDQQVPVHLIDIADPGYKYSLFEYQRDFTNAYKATRQRGKLPVLCGGSGMYIEAVTRRYILDEVPHNEALRRELETKSLDELAEILSRYKVLHNKTDLDSHERALRAIEIAAYQQTNISGTAVRPDLRTLFLGIRFERETERKRITERLHQRLERGMVEEVRQLLQSGISPETLIYYGLEYRYITAYLLGETEYQPMVSLLNTAIHQFAKRQRTWFRKMERAGCRIHWLDGELSMEEKLERASALINSA